MPANQGIENPHFRVPFAFRDGSAVCVEQDSDEDIIQCVNAIVRTAKGFRLELPDFGIANPVLVENGPALQEIERALELDEPRAKYHLSKSQMEDILSNIVNIGVVTNNG